MKTVLRDQVLGGFPRPGPVEFAMSGSPDRIVLSMTSERGVRAQAVFENGTGPSQGTALVIRAGTDLGADKTGEERAGLDEVKQSWHEAGFATLELSGRDLPRLPAVVGVADHTVAEWGVWVGRPLVGQWVWDVIRWLDVLDELGRSQTSAGRFAVKPARPFVLVGLGAMSLPALLAAGLDTRAAAVSCTGGLVSFVARTTRPWSGVPMGLLAPGILDVGDVGHLAALVAPRPLIYAGAVEPEGEPATPERTQTAFAFSRSIYQLARADDRLKLSAPAEPRALLPRP
jgi:hypothetical protein